MYCVSLFCASCGNHRVGKDMLMSNIRACEMDHFRVKVSSFCRFRIDPVFDISQFDFICSCFGFLSNAQRNRKQRTVRITGIRAQPSDFPAGLSVGRNGKCAILGGLAGHANAFAILNINIKHTSVAFEDQCIPNQARIILQFDFQRNFEIGCRSYGFGIERNDCLGSLLGGRIIVDKIHMNEFAVIFSFRNSHSCNDCGFLQVDRTIVDGAAPCWFCSIRGVINRSVFFGSELKVEHHSGYKVASLRTHGVCNRSNRRCLIG